MSTSGRKENIAGRYDYAFGLSVRLFIAVPSDVRSTKQNYYRKDINFHVYEGTVSAICCELDKSKFIGCASIIVCIHRERIRDLRALAAILRSIRNNKFLRYKSKFILCHYDASILFSVDRELRWQRFVNFVRGTSQTTSNCSCPCHDEDAPIRTFDSVSLESYKDRIRNPRLRLDIGKGIVKFDYDSFHSLAIENAVLLQNFVPTQDDVDSEFHTFWEEIFHFPEDPLQQIMATISIPCTKREWYTSTNADMYFYSINPALAIIINNYFFTKPHSIREGSDRDVMQLMRELKIAGIPFILLEDRGRKELIKLLDYLQQKNFYPIKSLMCFIMTHGHADNIIYTHDGELDLKKDVVRRIQANKSLADTENLIVINACRGDFDNDWDDLDDLQIESTDSRHLTENTVLFYSVPDNVKSPRCSQTGSPFVQTFAKIFRNVDHTSDLANLSADISNKLKENDYYSDLDQRCELVTANPKRSHKIRQMTVRSGEMLQLIKSITNDFPIREFKTELTSKSMFYVCGSVATNQYAKEKRVEEYFGKDLDSDLWAKGD